MQLYFMYLSIVDTLQYIIINIRLVTQFGLFLPTEILALIQTVKKCTGSNVCAL